MKRKILTLAAVLVMTATPFFSSGVAAYDSYPCSWPPQAEPGSNGNLVQKCPLWRGMVPVHAGRYPESPVVGYLASSQGNWFVCEQWGYRYTYGAYYNGWYALTLSDAGWWGPSRWGWVSEVYFAGGGNDESDGSLRNCV